MNFTLELRDQTWGVACGKRWWPCESYDAASDLVDAIDLAMRVEYDGGYEDGQEDIFDSYDDPMFSHDPDDDPEPTQ